jgi:hypothetical protein
MLRGTSMSEAMPLPLICTNEKCGRYVPMPITINDLNLNTKYRGCPFCFTELPEITVRKRDKPVHGIKISEGCTKKLTQSNPAHGPRQTEECSRKLGYLSERPKDEDIPEQCMTCPQIIECMLRKYALDTSNTFSADTSLPTRSKTLVPLELFCENGSFFRMSRKEKRIF